MEDTGRRAAALTPLSMRCLPCWVRFRVNDRDARKQKPARKQAFKFGSSDWTRTSDIRINSPPFYRLNYRGIVWSRILAAKNLCQTSIRPFRCNCRFHQQFVVISDNDYGKILCRISISRSSFEMLFQHLSLRSLLNVTSAVRRAVERTSGLKTSALSCAVLARNQPSRCAHPAGKCLCAVDGGVEHLPCQLAGQRGHGRVGRPIALTW